MCLSTHFIFSLLLGRQKSHARRVGLAAGIGRAGRDHLPLRPHRRDVPRADRGYIGSRESHARRIGLADGRLEPAGATINPQRIKITDCRGAGEGFDPASFRMPPLRPFFLNYPFRFNNLRPSGSGVSFKMFGDGALSGEPQAIKIAI